MPSRLRFGAFIAPFHRPGDHPGLALHRDLALVEHLDRLGYDEAWFGEHHSGAWETIGCPEIMVAAAAERTRHLRLGTGVVSLPLHHPFHVAERFAMLDQLTRGRVMLGVGSGALPDDARMLGLDPDRRGDLFAERLEAVTALLRADGPVSRHGEGFVLERALLQLRPRTPPDLYVASTFAGAALGHAARHGAGLLLLGGGRSGVGRFLAAEAALAADGLRLDRARVLLVLNIHVAGSRAEAMEAVRALATAEQTEYWEAIVGVPPHPDGPQRHLERMAGGGMLIAGSPDEVTAELRALLAAIGPVGGILVAARDWAPSDAMARSYELLARFVIPALDGSLTGIEAARAEALRDR